MKYLSLFSGIGGFEHAIHEVYGDEAECIGSSDIDRWANAVYKYHFPEHPQLGDARGIVCADLPDFDMLVGGFPCQAFSVAGKRRGFDDTRGTLFHEIARVLRDKQPECFLLENVKGLLSHDSGRTFTTIIGVLADAGYSIQWEVLNTSDWLPQNRERVFIVGHLGEERVREVFPLRREGESDDSQDERIVGEDISYCIDANYAKGVSPEHMNDGRRQLLFVGGLGTPRIEGQEHFSRGHKQHNRVFDPSGISPTISSQESQGRYNIVVPVLTPDRTEKRQNGRRMKENGESMFTISTQDMHGIYDGSRIRRLTPTECERLQGFPDGWCDVGMFSQQHISYNEYGNEICKKTIIQRLNRPSALWKIVTEKSKQISVIVSCTISDGKKVEMLNDLSEPITENSNVIIVIKNLGKKDVWECVISTTKCGDSTEIRSLWNIRDQSQAKTDISEKQQGNRCTGFSWNNISDVNSQAKNLFIISIAIRPIIESIISTFVLEQNMRVCIANLGSSSNNVLTAKVLSLETERIQPISDSGKYKMCGNAVTTVVVAAVLSAMK